MILRINSHIASLQESEVATGAALVPESNAAGMKTATRISQKDLVSALNGKSSTPLDKDVSLRSRVSDTQLPLESREGNTERNDFILSASKLATQRIIESEAAARGRHKRDPGPTPKDVDRMRRPQQLLR